jgi:hypothetical protein
MTGSARSDCGPTSKVLVRLIALTHPTSAARSEVFDIVPVIPKELNQDNPRDTVLRLVNQPLFQFDFGHLDLGEVNRHRSSRLPLSVHLSLTGVARLESSP